MVLSAYNIRFSLLSWRLAARVSAPSDRNCRRVLYIGWRLEARCAPPGVDRKIVRARRALAPDGEKVPSGGLGQFSLAALGVAPGENPTDYDLCVLLLSDNAILGSGDAVP
ncbi:hypothetical protein DEO72_LG8g1285 [Vigna unguiculata]|uniref:Uncharacterized protein n=1 Tax=Vigna unguiculata TaxID=3917 RepID=A0A4D6MRK6_VIGUN|nr:hypothetical protein DEO72_LG8g1285 [Vigna unguiculata]